MNIVRYSYAHVHLAKAFKQYARFEKHVLKNTRYFDVAYTIVCYGVYHNLCLNLDSGMEGCFSS